MTREELAKKLHGYVWNKDDWSFLDKEDAEHWLLLADYVLALIKREKLVAEVEVVKRLGQDSVFGKEVIRTYLPYYQGKLGELNGK